MQLRIEENRSARKYSRRVQVARVLWWFGIVVFRMTPKPFWGTRNLILRVFGARLGRGVRVDRRAEIYFPWNLSIGDHSAVGFGALIYNLGSVTIGQGVTISHRAHLCAGTHDYRDPSLPLIKSSITVGDQAWVCADALIGPDVKVAEGSVIGARAVLMRSNESWSVMTGNPAVKIASRTIRVPTSDSKSMGC